LRSRSTEVRRCGRSRGLVYWDIEAWGYGGMEVWESWFAGIEVLRYKVMTSGRFGGLEVWRCRGTRSGGMDVWRYGGLQAWMCWGMEV
jgi:hypothetical protein